MIKSEQCYIILDQNSKPAFDYVDFIFESMEEAETYLENAEDQPDLFEIISLVDFFEV